jgi:SRSO17 transposase
MSATSSVSSARQQRLTEYLDLLAAAAGHADRAVPLSLYCTGLLLPGERKSVEPMAARLTPENVRRVHQSLHHVVADAPWSDEAVLEQVRNQVLPAMTRAGPIVAWIVDDTGLPKKGTHSVGVARQYCGQTGKQDNCQVAVSLSVATWKASLPIAYRLYLPEAWANNRQLRQQTKIPAEIPFQTKLEIALGQMRQALADGVPPGTVLADPAYGNDTGFREAVAGMKLSYVVGVQSTTTVWPPGMEPLQPAAWKGGRGRPPSAYPLYRQNRFARLSLLRQRYRRGARQVLPDCRRHANRSSGCGRISKSGDTGGDRSHATRHATTRSRSGCSSGPMASCAGTRSLRSGTRRAPISRGRAGKQTRSSWA